MKAFTDLEQSKKLAEILPLESADMGWYYSLNPNSARNQMWAGTKAENADIPCWSLAALLDLIPDIIEEYVLRIDKVDGEYFIWYDKIGEGWSDVIDHPSSENFIDAAFEMVCWLKENKKI